MKKRCIPIHLFTAVIRLGLDPEMIYTMYQTIPSIKEKDDFVVNLTKSIFDPNFEIKNSADIQKFLHDLVGYYVIMEGIFFYAGFAMMLALSRQNKMIGIGQQFEYIMRDESIHLAFGCDLINTIKAENPEVWTPEFQNNIVALIKRAVELESIYAFDACPQGFLVLMRSNFQSMLNILQTDAWHVLVYLNSIIEKIRFLGCHSQPI